MSFYKKLEESPLDSLYTLIQEYLSILATRCASYNVWHALIKTIYCDNIMLNSSYAVIEFAVSFYHHWQHRGDNIRISHDLLTSPPLIPPKNYWIHSRGAKIQKIKRIDHSKCNVRASKNAEQAFSTQWYLYICNGLFFLFSSVP